MADDVSDSRCYSIYVSPKLTFGLKKTQISVQKSIFSPKVNFGEAEIQLLVFGLQTRLTRKGVWANSAKGACVTRDGRCVVEVDS